MPITDQMMLRCEAAIKLGMSSTQVDSGSERFGRGRDWLRHAKAALAGASRRDLPRF
jgi:hypothetical protein